MLPIVSRFSKLLNGKSLLLVAISTNYYLFCAAPVCAQQVSQQIAPPAEMHPGVRYTTGYTETRGWEANLIKGNSNLAHWNWSPIVSYTQSSPSKPTGKQAGGALMVVPLASHYVKPRHAAMPLSELQISELNASRACAARLAQQKVSARLRSGSRFKGDANGRLMNTPMLSYGQDYGRASAFGSGSISKAEVYGVVRSH